VCVYVCVCVQGMFGPETSTAYHHVGVCVRVCVCVCVCVCPVSKMRASSREILKSHLATQKITVLLTSSNLLSFYRVCIPPTNNELVPPDFVTIQSEIICTTTFLIFAKSRYYCSVASLNLVSLSGLYSPAKEE